MAIIFETGNNAEAAMQQCEKKEPLADKPNFVVEKVATVKPNPEYLVCERPEDMSAATCYALELSRIFGAKAVRDYFRIRAFVLANKCAHGQVGIKEIQDEYNMCLSQILPQDQQ